MLVRKQRRVKGKKVNYWLDTETGKEYTAKPVRKQHSERSDKKCVSHNNVLVVALRLCEETEPALITMLDAVYADTHDAKVLEQMQLVAATKQALYECIFVSGCHPSPVVYIRVMSRARRLAYKFLMEFYPDELNRVSNKDEKTFRTHRVERLNKYLGDVDGYDAMSDTAGYAKYCAEGKPPFTELSDGKVYTEAEKSQLRKQFGVTCWD